MEEIPNNHLGCINPVNNGIHYQPQLPINWLAGFQPSTVLHGTAWHHIKCHELLNQHSKWPNFVAHFSSTNRVGPLSLYSTGRMCRGAIWGFIRTPCESAPFLDGKSMWSNQCHHQRLWASPYLTWLLVEESRINHKDSVRDLYYIYCILYTHTNNYNSQNLNNKLYRELCVFAWSLNHHIRVH